MSGINKLSILKIKNLSQRGRYSDGNGLYLQISKTKTKSWIFRYKFQGEEKQLGLGSINLVSLSDARQKVLEFRKQVLEGQDPISNKRLKERNEKIKKSKEITFSKCAEAYISSLEPEWKNKKHIQQWRSTLATYVFPMIGELSVQDIDTTLVVNVLKPIWITKTETATRIRSRLELIMGWATVRGYRSGENPARWRGHLDKLLPKPSKVSTVKHHKALKLHEIHRLILELRRQTCFSSKALEFLILTASRTSEVLNMKWNELSLDASLWTVPALRMKGGKDHTVPLSKSALEILNFMQTFKCDEYVFPGFREGRPLSNMAMLKLTKRLGYSITVHGFRSTFRDWAAEHTNFSRETAEAALAHTIKDKVEAAYRRGDLILKRRVMMEEWSKFIEQPMDSGKNILGIKDTFVGAG